jgi:hypothetical protein
MGFLETHPWPTAVLVDEVDAGCLKGAADHVKDRTAWFAEASSSRGCARWVIARLKGGYARLLYDTGDTAFADVQRLPQPD